MGKSQDSEVSRDELISQALRILGEGFTALAAALIAPSVANPEPRPAARRPQTVEQPPAEEPDEEAEVDEEDPPAEESSKPKIKLSQLQDLARDIIKAKKRDDLRKILEGHDLETVSSAPEKLWPTLKTELEELLG